MQMVSLRDNLHEMSDPISWKNKKNVSKCCLLKFLPSMLRVNNNTSPIIQLCQYDKVFSHSVQSVLYKYNVKRTDFEDLKIYRINRILLHEKWSLIAYSDNEDPD